jgi:hypothetical protein
MAFVYIARAVTNSNDTYVFVFSSEPTDEQVINTVMDWEGADPEDDREFYTNTTSITIQHREVIDRLTLKS